MYKKTFIFKNKKTYKHFMDNISGIKIQDAVHPENISKAFKLSESAFDMLYRVGASGVIFLLPSFLDKLSKNPTDTQLQGAVQRELAQVKNAMATLDRVRPLIKQIESLLR